MRLHSLHRWIAVAAPHPAKIASTTPNTSETDENMSGSKSGAVASLTAFIRVDLLCCALSHSGTNVNRSQISNLRNQLRGKMSKRPLEPSCAENDGKALRTEAWADAGLEATRQALRGFAAERDWEQFHSPRNLALALVGEVLLQDPNTSEARCSEKTATRLLACCSNCGALDVGR